MASLQIAWPLWAALGAVPWLLPTRTEPWTTFWADALTAAVWLLLAAVVVSGACRGRGQRQDSGAAVAIDALPVAALGLVPFIALQAAAGRLVFSTEAIVLASYPAAFASAIVIGRYCTEHAGARFTDHLWASLFIAALLSAGHGMAQWLRVEPLDWLTPPAQPDGRAIANVGQANHLATLICWGLLAVWRARLTGLIGGAAAWLVAAYLMFGLALTQSRTPWVIALTVVLVAWAGRRALGVGRPGWAPLTLPLIYVAGWAAMIYAPELLGLSAPRSAADPTTGGLRLAIWRLALEAIAERPLLGWGWNQFWVAWTSLAPGRFPVASPEGYAHNLVLDLLIWNGLLVGGGFVAAVSWWLWRVGRAARTAEQWLLLAGVSVFLVHSMLELPHAYLLMLLPVAGMIGALSATAPLRPLLRVRRRWVGLAAIGLASLLVAFAHDYSAIEERRQSQRIREVRILATQPLAPLDLVILRWMAEVDTALRPRPPEAMSADDTARLRTTLTRYASAGGFARYAQAAALHGDLEGAAWGLRTLCGLHRRHICEPALREWREFTRQHPSAASVPLPQLPET